MSNKIKRKYGITDADIAKFFGYKNANSFNTSSAKDRIKKGLLLFLEAIEKKKAA